MFLENLKARFKSIFRQQQTAQYPFLVKCASSSGHYSFWIHDSTSNRWYNKEDDRNRIEKQELASLLSANDTILEVGVHYGYFACFMKAVQQDARYYGIEMSPRCTVYAQSNLALNKYTNVEVYNGAAAEYSNQDIFYTSTLSGNDFISSGRAGNSRIATISLDDFCDKRNIQPTLIKIDVEGYELNVIKGAKKVLENKPKLALELHLNQLNILQRKEILSLINAHKYSGYIFNRKTRSLEDFDKQIILESKEILNLFLVPK
jgi:FkbM family methyltransferase